MEFLWRLVRRWQLARGLARPAALPAPRPGDRLLLHVGCGSTRKEHTSPGFQSHDWVELRLDIDPAAAPDILGTLTDMSAVPAGTADAVFSSHTLEHLYHHEVPSALAEMMRVLKPEGIVVSRVPDLQAAARMIAEDRLFETAYLSPAGPVTPFDMVYSHRQFVGRDRPYMAHHGGFTATSLGVALAEAGFPAVTVRAVNFELWALASKAFLTEAELARMATVFLPPA
jgi:SAM-dependent methyltransferase